MRECSWKQASTLTGLAASDKLISGRRGNMDTLLREGWEWQWPVRKADARGFSAASIPGRVALAPAKDEGALAPSRPSRAGALDDRAETRLKQSSFPRAYYNRT